MTVQRAARRRKKEGYATAVKEGDKVVELEGRRKRKKY